MDKSQLLSWLHEEHQRWQTLLDQVGLERMDRPGIHGRWSMKDLTAHLATWNQRLVENMQAAQRAAPEPPPPWPTHLREEDDINTWIYAAHHERAPQEVLAYSEQVFQQLFQVIVDLPLDVQVDVIQESHPFYLVRVGEKRFLAGEFFDHFHDDHEQDIRLWLAQGENKAQGSLGNPRASGRGLNAED
jgi:ribosomal protein L31